MSGKQHTEYLRYNFTEEEIKAKSTQLAQANLQIEQLSDEKKQIMAGLNARVATAAATVALLSSHINTGYEFRNIDCTVTLNMPRTGMKSIYRKETGEFVRSEVMTGAELQERLDFERKMEMDGKELERKLNKGLPDDTKVTVLTQPASKRK